MAITQFRAANVKRLDAVNIKPDGSLVIIGGANGAGKSSCLDALLYALAGNRTIPAQPVRRGQKQADVIVNIDGDPPLVVRKRIKPDGSATLEITEERDELAITVRSPQKLLDSLVGRIAFDPLEFVRQKPAEQVATLREIVGVDTTDVDVEIDRAFHARTDAAREVKRLEAVVGQCEVFPDAPAEEQSVRAIIDQIAEADERNRKVEALENLARRTEHDAELAHQAVAKQRERVDELREMLAEAEALQEKRIAERDRAVEVAAEKLREAKAAERVDTAPLYGALESVETVNAQVRANAVAAGHRDELDKMRTRVEKLTERIDTCRQKRLALMDAAEWPVEGLGFSEDGVTFNGLPFDQCSSAEQLRISTAIGLSSGAKLNIAFIRDGSLLDADSLAAVAETAERLGGQVWIERVSAGDECTVVITDGHVASAEEREALQAAASSPVSRKRK